MLKKINLEEILKKELIPAINAGNSELTFNAVIRAMREACFQTLELAYENSKANAKSILDTMQQVVCNE